MNCKKITSIALWFLISGSSYGQITSTFDTDADGWTAAHVGGTAATSTYMGSGGNPNGYLSSAPPTSGGTTNTSFTWYWIAPAKFFGNHDFSYNAAIKLDLQQSVAGTDNSQSDIIITGPSGSSIHFRFASKPAVSPAWTSYSIPLNETAGWNYGGTAGAPAVAAHIKQVLSNITSIRIRCKYINSPGYSSGIDNVILETRTLEASPVITSFTPATALPGAPITITGSNFGATAGSNIVYFGNVKASVVTASTTQIVVNVPSAATFSPISVINTTTSLVTQSPLDFIPLSVSDPDFIGHILPSSFATNIVIPYGDFNDNGLAGGNLGDIDNDGLLDIIAFEDGQDKFAIFLNLGHAGIVSATSFSSKIEIPSGELSQGNSYGTLLADFDNDGKIDIATFFRGTNPAFAGGFVTSRNISTPGNILFEPAEQFYSASISSSGLDVADLDGDGRLDFLINSGGLRYARNISTPGNIDFAALQFLDAAGGAVSTKDLNGDGKPEVMVVGSNNYELLENISTPGNIQFTAPVVFPGAVISGITLADLDSDNKADIIYYRINGFNNYDLVVKKNVHTTGSLTVSSFGADILLSKINRAYSQCVADLNGDAKPEIFIVANSGSAGYGFAVFENITEPGTLGIASFLPEVDFEETATGVLAIPLIGDIDGDSKPDVIGFGSSDGGEHSLILYHNGSIAAPHISLNTITPLSGPVGSAVTITGERFSTDPAKNSVWFGGVKANVLAATKTTLTVEVPAGASYDRISVTRDFLISRYHLPFVTTFSPGITFDGTSFLPPVSYPLTGADYDVEVADLNGDGKPEMIAESHVVTGIIRNYAWSYKNVHTSGPITAASFIVTDTTNESAYNLRVVDLDEDGRPDIISQNSIFRNSTVTDEIEFDNDVTGATGGYQTWGDFDLDGKTDIVLANVGGAVLQLFRNMSQPTGFRTGAFATFSGAINLGKPAAGGGTASGDFDKDGLTEFVSTNPATDNMSVWRNTGGFPLTASQFAAVGDIPAGDNPGRVYPGDLDVDGKMDLMLYHNTGTNTTLISVFHNQSTTGNIAFNKIDFTIPAAATVAHISDLDGDGRPEILVISEGTDQFFILKNTSTAGVMNASSFAAPFPTAVNNPRGITTGDLNLDGKPEIIITSAPNSLLVYENAISSVAIIVTTQPAASSVCDGSSATFTIAATGTTNITYQWQFSATLAGTYNDITNTGGYSNVGTPTLSVNTSGNFGAGFYRCKINGDLAGTVFSNPAQLTIFTIPTAPTVTDAARCGSGTVVLSAAGATNGQYRWYTVATGGTSIGGETNNTFTTPSVSSTTNYYVAVSNGTCESQRVAVQATINPLPAKPTITANKSTTICTGNSVDLSAPLGFSSYAWSTGATTAQINVGTAGVYTVQVTDAKGCTSASSDAVSVGVQDCSNNQAPTATSTSVTSSIGGSVTVNVLGLLADPDDNLDLSTLRIATPPQSGALATIDPSGTLTIDYNGIAFSGTDNLQIEVCDIAGRCAQAEVLIEVIGDITVYNALSPSGANPIFVIQYIELLPDTKNNEVIIFDRWQNEVWRGTNYNNSTVVFTGAGKSGTDLPPGTYFYKIQFGGARKGKTGFISLKR